MLARKFGILGKQGKGPPCLGTEPGTMSTGGFVLMQPRGKLTGHHQICLLRKGRERFELVCNPGTVGRFRDGEIQIDAVLISDVIFKNYSKTERATDVQIHEAFGDMPLPEILREILLRGEIELTTAERRVLVDEKRRQILTHIHKYYTDQQGLPHPITRLESALEGVRFIIDPFVPAERQALDLVELFKGTLILKKSEMEGSLSIPHAFLGAAQGIIRKWAEIKREQYTAEACVMEVGIIPGNYESFMSDLQRVTHGEHTFELAGHRAAAPPPPEEHKAKKGAKKGRRVSMATLICLGVPQTGILFGVDNNVWETGPLFRGVSGIPTGIHYFAYRSKATGGAASPSQMSFFYNFAPDEIVVLEWSSLQEHFEFVGKESDQYQRVLVAFRKGEFSRELGPFPTENVPKWVALAKFISPRVIERISPPERTIHPEATDDHSEHDLSCAPDTFMVSPTLFFRQQQIELESQQMMAAATGGAGQDPTATERATLFTEERRAPLEVVLDVARVAVEGLGQLLVELLVAVVDVAMPCCTRGIHTSFLSGAPGGLTQAEPAAPLPPAGHPPAPASLAAVLSEFSAHHGSSEAAPELCMDLTAYLQQRATAGPARGPCMCRHCRHPAAIMHPPGPGPQTTIISPAYYRDPGSRTRTLPSSSDITAHVSPPRLIQAAVTHPALPTATATAPVSAAEVAAPAPAPAPAPGRAAVPYMVRFSPIGSRAPDRPSTGSELLEIIAASYPAPEAAPAIPPAAIPAPPQEEQAGEQESAQNGGGADELLVPSSSSAGAQSLAMVNRERQAMVTAPHGDAQAQPTLASWPQPQPATDLVGEMQAAFVTFLYGQCMQGFVQWKRLVALFCRCDAAVRAKPVLFGAFMEALIGQLEEVSADILDIENDEDEVIPAERGQRALHVSRASGNDARKRGRHEESGGLNFLESCLVDFYETLALSKTESPEGGDPQQVALMRRAKWLRKILTTKFGKHFAERNYADADDEPVIVNLDEVQGESLRERPSEEDSEDGMEPIE
ncbi:putative rRNA metabolism protein; SBDS family [Paratrimastix pyriformis]|uniref:rRNA metabolism protein n=1 Tax=Paratrimastix pyriformis TaxID=342808 RepID=A0ABQ8UPC4_9EUKA|nr:putative rRNA metabolism protein; SBDS family [Paratrimastix pyriformis]